MGKKNLFINNENINIIEYFTNKNFNFKTIINFDNFGDDEKMDILIKKIPFYRFSDINISSNLFFLYWKEFINTQIIPLII